MKSLLAAVLTAFALSALSVTPVYAADKPPVKKHKKAEKVTSGAPTDPVAKPEKKKK